MNNDQEIQAQIQRIASESAQRTVSALEAAPRDFAAHKERLQDLKLTTVRAAAELAGAHPGDDLVWDLAAVLPDYDDQSLYQARSSLLALACAVFLGWLLGGFLATFLDFLGLGGEIIRPAAILSCVWLEEYLGTNPRARKIMLTVLGLGGLARLAAAMAAGVARFTSLGSIRQLIFGVGARPNIFKTAWLWFGACLLFVFFARKTTGLDLGLFRQNLARQIAARLSFLRFVFRELQMRDNALESVKDRASNRDSSLCPKKDCQLARAAISLLDSLDGDKAAWLASSLALAGYEPKDIQSDYLIWSPDQAENYEPVGLVKAGDRCRILKRPFSRNGVVSKGQVQRLAP